MVLTLVSKKVDSSGVVIVALQGIPDANLDLRALIGPPPKNLRIDCSGINHMNSGSIRPWLAYFQAAKDAGSVIVFEHCSLVLIDYFNMIPDLVCGGKVVSVIAPFYCKNCSREINIMVETPNLQSALSAIVGKTCESCGKAISMDANPSEYFRFLE